MYKKTNSELITGIQQIGIGVKDANQAKYIYRDLFGMDVLVFDDVKEANLMTQYTGNTVHQRQAILALNLQGGGGFEIWQFKSRTPSEYNQVPLLGDFGIYAAKIKAKDLASTYQTLKKQSGIKVSEIINQNEAHAHLWVQDMYGNTFQFVEAEDWFSNSNKHCGGVIGGVIGVSNTEKAIQFYADFLGIDKVTSSETVTMVQPFSNLIEPQEYKRTILRKTLKPVGAFSQALGSIEIELIEALERKPNKIFENRYWGDCGFIHLCFDVLDMDTLKQKSETLGYKFTVDSANSFVMDKAAGRFCYVEDPDGTLIELVETHKVPILKKIGWYLDLKKRKNNTPLPKWMIKLMGLSKVN